MPSPPQKSSRPGSTEEIAQAITQKMRDTYREIGRSLIPLLGNSPEDLQTLLELGEVYENLGCTEDAVRAYARARQLDPRCLPEGARAFLERHLPSPP